MSVGRVQIQIPIAKADEEKRLVYGVVLEPAVVDAQGDWESPEVIQKAAHNFLSRYNSGSDLGLQHEVIGAAKLGIELVESYIAPQDIDFDGLLVGDAIIRKGSWVMVVHVLDDEIWAAVRDGEITGFSIGGIATVLDDG